MKKLIFVLSASLSLISTLAMAETQDLAVSIPGKLSLRGDYRVRYDSLDQTDFASRRNVTYLRVRPELDWELNPEFSLVFQPQAAKAFGEPGFTPSSTTANKRQDTSGATNGDTMMTFHQAYGKWTPLRWLEFSAGRQVLAYGNELVIGPADWTNVSRTFDVLRLRATHAWGWTDIFTSKISDSNISTGGPGDKDLHGIYTGLNFGTYLENLDVYLLDLHDATLQPPVTTVALGARAQSHIHALDYRAEFTRETNYNVNSGYQGNGEVGYSLDVPVKPRLSLEYFYASADYNQLFPSAHRWLGYADIFGRRNIRGFGLHLNSAIVANYSAQFDAYTFSRVDNTRSAYKLDGQTTLGSGTASSSSDLGKEFDLTLKMQVNKELALSAGYCILLAEDYFKDQFGKMNPQYYYAAMEARF